MAKRLGFPPSIAGSIPVIRSEFESLMSKRTRSLARRQGFAQFGPATRLHRFEDKAEELKQGRKDRLVKGQAKKKEAATVSSINQGVVTLGAEAEAQCQSPGAEHPVNSEEFEMAPLPEDG